MNNRPNHRKSTATAKPRVCYFCINGITDIDYKDNRIMQKSLSGYSKILPRRRTGTCLKHQRKLANAIKRARFMALIPFVTK
ncbi:MAG: 30S ribosomal protein S18 [Candidatus Kerfeldbacteria bacterium]|nr:30S ribosomal protein S18 [Candidatus Kerfeldbacteria bacterium]